MDDEIEECQKAFQFYDKVKWSLQRTILKSRKCFFFFIFIQVGNGAISPKDLGLAMRSLGLNPTEQVLMEMIYESADVEEFGRIEFVEFLRMVKRVKNENDSETIRSAFRAFDRDKNGLITAEEFRTFMTEVGEQLTDEEVNEFFRGVDVDGDGHINYEEFVKMFAGK